MKHAELIRQLKRAGYYLLREGGAHEIWSDGEDQVSVPRHREVNERLARAIIRRIGG